MNAIQKAELYKYKSKLTDLKTFKIGCNYVAPEYSKNKEFPNYNDSNTNDFINFKDTFLTNDSYGIIKKLNNSNYKEEEEYKKYKKTQIQETPTKFEETKEKKSRIVNTFDYGNAKEDITKNFYENYLKLNKNMILLTKEA